MAKLTPIQEAWQYKIDQANRYGLDDQRKLYIQLRDAGIDPKWAAAQGGFDFENGLSYNPIEGSLAYGTDYLYNMGRNQTLYGGTNYQGYFDPGVLGLVSDEDLKAATTGNQAWLDKAEHDYNAYLEGEYANEQAKLGEGNATVDVDAFLRMKGADKRANETSQEYNQRILQDAYMAAYNRMNPDNPMTQFMSGQRGSNGFLVDAVNQDWLAAYKGLQAPKEYASNADVEAIKARTDIPDAVKESLLKNIDTKMGTDYSSSLSAAYDNTKPPTPSSDTSRSDLGGMSTNEYSTQRDAWLEAGNKGDFKETLPKPPSPTSPAQVPGNPAPQTPAYQQPEAQDLDWTGLYDSLSTALQNFNSKPAQATQPKEQITNYYDYGPSASSKSTTYKSTTPYSSGSSWSGTTYSGKGA